MSPAERERPLRVLFLTTRDLGQRSSGRVTVLRTHVEALAALGHAVTLGVVAPKEPQDSEWTERFRTVHVRTPRLPSVAGSAASGPSASAPCTCARPGCRPSPDRRWSRSPWATAR